MGDLYNILLINYKNIPQSVRLRELIKAKVS